jgi:hypothetical protein
MRKVPVADIATPHHLTVLRPSSSYSRRPAQVINMELTRPIFREQLRRDKPGRTPAEGVAVLRDVTISGQGVIRFADGSVLAESTERPELEELEYAKRAAARGLDVAVHVAKAGNKNYGHFLVEILPRLSLNVGAYPDDVPILLHKNSRPFALPMLDHIGIDCAMVEWVGDAPVDVRTLYWPTRNTFHPLDNSPHSIAYLQDLGQRARKCAPDRRLFVSRRDATNRQLLNEDEVFAVLEPHGFERVTAGLMSFEQQIQKFAEARVVVAVCGAALTNLVFMPRGGRVVMLTPESMAGWFFWDLSSQCGHELVVVYGETSDRFGPVTLDFTVDARAITSLL